MRSIEADRERKRRREQWQHHGMLKEIEKLEDVPAVYYALFYHTGAFCISVQDQIRAFAAGAPGNWAKAACLLVDWSVQVLRSDKVGFERFLHTQRYSIYWILDDALLRILADQWEDRSSLVPWDKCTAPICLALSKAQHLIPTWADCDFKEIMKWHPGNFGPAEALEDGYFRRSQRFLVQSLRVHEIWRTVTLGGKGMLPAELANAIAEDVARFEGLPLEDLRVLYFPRGKAKVREVVGDDARGCTGDGRRKE